MNPASDLEQILLQLSVPDNKLIQQATNQLRNAFTNPNIVAALVQVLSDSTNATVRQYAAILLRRRIVKHWNKLAPDVKNGLKTSLLETLGSETEHLVRKASCQVISSIAKQEFKNNGWPEVLQHIANAVKSQNPKQKEIGFLLLSCVCESSGEMLKPFYTDLFPVFEMGLIDKENRKLAFYSIKGMTSLVPFFGTDEEALIKPIIPKAMDVVKELLQTDEDKACEGLDLFDELVEIEVGIIIPYVKPLVELCLQIAQCDDFGDTIRVKALYLVCWACRRKAKALLKSQLLGPLLEILLSLMSLTEHVDLSENESNEDEDAEEEMEGSTLPSVAAQALDLLALHLPPGKFIPQVMLLIQRLLASSNCYQRKAAFIALGVLAEGCSDYIRNRHLHEALQTVSRGLSDESHVVSNAALFTLGQFAEHLQPDINKFHGDIVPVLLVHLQNTLSTHDAKQKTTMTRIYYALDSLCENLEKEDICPYLEQLVKTFLGTIESNKGIYATELAISAIGSLANSAKDALLPYFSVLMDHLKVFLKEPADLETSSLQAQAVDTLGALARNIGGESFKSVAHDCVQLGMNLLEDSDDPDIRRCTYALFSSLSTVLKNDMEKYLSKIIPKMLESLRSTEGIVAQFSEEEPAFLLDDELDEGDLIDGDDDDDDVEGYTVENAYLDEKEDTCNALSELSEQTGPVFLPFIEECFKEVFFLVDESHVNLRKASITSCATFCKVLQQTLQENGATDFTPGLALINKTVPVALEMISKDTDRSGVMAAIDSLNEILQSLKFVGLQNQEFIQSIANAINEILLERTPCQRSGEDDTFTDDDEESQAELDAMLIEKTGDILPSLAQAVGAEVFKPYFAGLLPQLVKRARKNCAVSEKSFAVGTLAEVIQAMQRHISDFVPQLAELFLETLKDEDEEVVSNSAFALGVLAESGSETTISYYGNILQALFTTLNNKSTPLVSDNVCGAVARMIMASGNTVPLDQVIPVIVQHLPIKEDKRENETVMKCFAFLYQSGNQVLLAHAGHILTHLLQSLLNSDSGLTEETRLAIKIVLVDIQQRFPNDFMSVLNNLGISHNILETI